MSVILSFEGPPDKQRLIAAMRGEPTDGVPNFEILILGKKQLCPV